MLEPTSYNLMGTDEFVVHWTGQNVLVNLLSYFDGKTVKQEISLDEVTDF